MLKIYGSDLCKDCIACKADLDRAGVEYEYCSITDNLAYLKEFLAIRESAPIFSDAKQNGYIGIPCILNDEGSVMLDWENLI